MSFEIYSKMIGGLSGIISGGISVDDFSAVTALSASDSEKILDD